MFIDFDKIENARDLGGICVGGGKTIKPGLLIRSAKLDKPSEADKKKLSDEYRLRYIVDFRDGAETAALPDVEIDGAQLVFAPVLPKLPEADGMSIHIDPVALFDRIYREFAECDCCAEAYRKFFDILLRGEGALWHCTQGKDRTGIASILLLSALGAGWEDIERDYYLTNEYIRPHYEAYVATLTTEREKFVAKEVAFVYPRCLNIFLSIVDEKYGCIANFLRSRIKLTDDEIEKLKNLYTH